MPLFQISLRDTNNDVSLSVVGSALVIKDYSNYIASTETGNTQAKFNNFKYISVRKYNATDKYEFCTWAGYDGLLALPSSYLAVPETTNYTFTEDGLYEVQLIALPKYDVAITYDNTHYVTQLGYFYESLVNNNLGNALTDATKWRQINAVQGAFTDAELAEISYKYRDVEYKEVVASVQECFMDLVYQVNCVILNTDCNYTDLCSNKTWLNTNLMQIIFECLPQMVLDQEYDKAVELINQLGLMCNCCS